MSGEAPKGRGRARGRARAAAAAAAPPQPAAAQNVPTASSSTSSGAQQRPIGRSGARGAGAVSDLTSRTQAMSVSSGGNGGDGNGNGNGGNGNGAPIGRGNVRSGRYIDPSMLHTRPDTVAKDKTGSTGAPRRIQTNYFELINKKWTLYKHHVDFNPPEDRTFIRRMMVREHNQKLGGSGYLFDGSTIFATQPLCQEGSPLTLISVRKSDEERIQITIKKVAGVCGPSDMQHTQVFNIILRKCLGSLGLQEIRRNYYDPAAKIPIPEYNLELWPGYVSSIGQYENSILMCAEINYKVLRTDTAYHLFREILARNPQNVRTEFSMAIIGSMVLTTYNNKSYRVDDVDYSCNPKQTFQKKTREGVENIEYGSYFQKTYNAKISDMGQPMLVSRSNARQVRSGQSDLVYLVPELCVMTGLTDEMRSNYQLMRATAQHTAVGPADRVKRILNYGQRLIKEPKVQTTLKEWGMSLTPRLVETEGRILPPVDILVGGGKRYNAGPDVDWTRNLRSSLMLHPVQCNKWLIVYPHRNDAEAGKLFMELNKVGKPMGFTMCAPVKVQLPNDSVSAYVQETDKFIHNENPAFVLFLFPNNRSDRYAAVKKKCILERPVPSQVVLLKSVRHATFTSIATKIAIQINCKLGGAPWSLEIPMKGLMIVGYDVCHDPRDKRKSFGAMVATTDNTYVRYFSVIKHHPSGEELSLNFGLSVAMAARRYREVNNELPRKIIIYRDGVGDGSLEYVKEQEVKNIEKQVGELYKDVDYKFELVFVVVTKRINTRLFDNGRNPAPGTIVDDVITNPHRYDFYLVSQSVRQGTVSPTHYNIIADGTKLKPDVMQQLTYRLTHMYFNWSGTVRVPAPCQYAHKLAFLTSQSVGADHSNLNNMLYFL